MRNLDFQVVGLRIKRRREEVDITQETVANALNVNPSHISNIECGRAHPSLTALVNIANVLQCSVDYFIGGEYTFHGSQEKEDALEAEIIEKIKCSDLDRKRRMLKILELL